MNRFQLKRQLAVICSIDNMPFVILNWSCPPELPSSFMLWTSGLHLTWYIVSKRANIFHYLKVYRNFYSFKSQFIQVTGLSLQHLYNLINGNYIPNDSKFDKLCWFQNLPHWADFQITGSFKCHTRRHPIHHHTARVDSDFSVWDFHWKIHTNGFT